MEEVTMLVARRGVSPAWSHDKVSLLVNLTPGVKLHLDTTEYGVCFPANMFSAGSFAGQHVFKQPHHYSIER